MRRHLVWPLPAVAAALVLAGCSGTSSDSGGSSETSSSASSSAAAAPVSPQIEEAVKSYQAYAVEQTDELVAAVKKLTDAVRAGDLKAAQDAYAPSRAPWERIEPLAGLVEEIDGKVDARVDDFAGIDDPKFTGWHRIEYLIFDKNTTEGGAPFADQLDADIATLQKQMPTLTIAPVEVPKGAADLIEEVSEGKITGEEDRYAKTDLWDIDNNLLGSQAAINTLKPALQEADPELLAKIEKGFTAIFATLQPLRQGDGWVLYCTEKDPYPSPRCPAVTVPAATVDTLKAQLAGLSEDLSQVAGVLKLQ